MENGKIIISDKKNISLPKSKKSIFDFINKKFLKKDLLTTSCNREDLVYDNPKTNQYT